MGKIIEFKDPALGRIDEVLKRHLDEVFDLICDERLDASGIAGLIFHAGLEIVRQDMGEQMTDGEIKDFVINVVEMHFDD
tara:strand:- start:1815 stop:2054 length:240 start_codon:yes stop_codon:yes gene_type:complete